MMVKDFFSDWGRLKSENGTYRVITIGLTAALIASVFANYLLFQNKTVLVLPPKITQEFQVTGNELSTSYIEQVGFYLADRILSVSPQNVDASFDTIIPFLTTNPEAVKVIKEQYATQAAAVKNNDIYQVFYPMKIFTNNTDGGGRFSVEGHLKKMTGNTLITSGKTTVNFVFIVKNGQMIITNIEVK